MSDLIINPYRFASAAFSPLDIGWTHAFWAEDPSWTNPGDGNPVSSWRNDGTDGTAATQGTGANQPTYLDSVGDGTLNDQPVIRFDAATSSANSRYLDTSGAGSLSQPFTIVVVSNTGTADPGQFDEISVVEAPDTAGTDRIILRPSSLSLTNAMNAGTTRRFGSAISAVDSLIIAKYNRTTSTFDANGATPTVSGDIGANTMGDLRIGADPNGNTWIDGGYIAFIGVYNGTLSAGNISDLKSWATSHYGISIS